MNAMATWGPALDAEIDYRAESLRADGRPTRGRHEWRRRRGGRTSAALAARNLAAAQAELTSRPGTPVPDAAEPSRRQWPLTGSGAWPAAR